MAAHSSILALENPMDRGAWQAAVHRVAPSQPRLKQLIKPPYECTLLIPRRRTSLVALMVKRLPTMWETRVQSLGWEDLLEKEMATHSNILA